MKITPVFTGRIDHGKLILDAPRRYLVHLARLDGKPIELIVRSTAKLNTEKFVAYVDRGVRWAAQEHQLYIPDPGQVEYKEAAHA